ncbi:hypothetical protein HanRHA438_Chr10g0432151 [Helianthus annuus]|nr:hypothetical protein HanRHA438_Chr10g0432151 [Helianthus annuus]
MLGSLLHLSVSHFPFSLKRLIESLMLGLLLHLYLPCSPLTNTVAQHQPATVTRFNNTGYDVLSAPKAGDIKPGDGANKCSNKKRNACAKRS